MSISKAKKTTAIFMSFVMLFTLTSCALDMDFIRYGWDGIVDGERIWGEERPTSKKDKEEKSSETEGDEVTDNNEGSEEITEVVTDKSGEVVTDKSGEAVTKTVHKPSGSTNGTSSKTNSGNTNSGTGTTTLKQNNPGNSSSSADAISVFNAAVNSGRPSGARYNLTATDATFKSSKSALDSIFSSAFTKDDVAKQNASNLTANHSAFTTISASDCSSTKITDNGSSYTVTLMLKNVSLPASAFPAKNGYLYFLNSTEVTATVHKANSKITFMKNGTISLSNGVITATVDKSSGKFTSCKLDLNEVYYDEIYLKDLLADAPSAIVGIIGDATLHGTFSYKLSVTYSF